MYLKNVRYDGNRTLIGFKDKSTNKDYFYLKNLQGDIVRIIDSTGNVVVTYEYDAWGKLLSTTGSLASTIGKENPFRYRGYYYDTESSLYYLNSRYYDPETGRFINADEVSYLGADGSPESHNLFAYCKNNPITGYDPTGHFSWKDVFNFASVVTLSALAVIAIVGTGGGGPLLAAAGAVAGTTVSATAVTTAATGIATAGVTTMGVAAVANSIGDNISYSKNNNYEGRTTYNKEGVSVHYEYNGNGTGNVHLHNGNAKIHIYTIDNGVENFLPLSRAVKKIVGQKPIKNAISKAIGFVRMLCE